ncbi:MULTISPECIES: Na/Pi cotransporter family protein [Pseudomonas]|uniref:Na/Pi cotransporter family protein n=1 Tax=Pseudomonadaceae TaxID=135621 RepID=UPI001267F846|nr:MULTISPECIES: Na/Pi symporter [Pseudomonas]QFT24295.1 Na+/Pi-cotransporter [Pseudomonas sp. THAF187a]QFT44482.1 Na+/Pi-cotransporter [Pseudomonas sp. THAF42]QTS86113.1 Na/Pi cotransporter family protein [Pseudomonas khazarica]HIQ42182.1 Na/Pi cotransporter family protein [Pseudomonas oleovorans]|tara:strand:+ start:12303 stop:14135 length:1833 start_codon:yes stop_codon:yes gene_type:complete
MKYLRWVMLCLLVVGLIASFWFSQGWLQLCAGLAVFLFGMQCLEEGLRQLAGSKLEQILARSTSTSFKSLLFGIGGTLLLQSSTLVSLLTIAFISTGLIQLAGGIAILFGANLGATSGIWLLALAGQNLSLSPLALPLLVFGVLAGFFGTRSKAAGRIVLGIAFIFLGIDQIKDGFASFGDLDMTGMQAGGLAGALLFTAIGMAITVVLQSSHATLMLTLAALASGQLELGQSLAIAIGSNVGSSVTTAFVGSLGGNRSGQRLALAHVLFNITTGTLAFCLLGPLTWLVHALAEPLGLGDNSLIQLAMFHTLFNAMGVALFWPLQERLARVLIRWLPERAEPQVLITELLPEQVVEPQRTQARYLSERALDSVEAASGAVVQELGHLGRLSLEVICHALYLPVDQLARSRADEQLLQAKPSHAGFDAEHLYQFHIKGVYGDLLSFMGRMELPMDEAHQQFWVSCQLAALQLVDAVKDAKHLQKNLGHYLDAPPSAVRDAYVELRRHLLTTLHEVRELARSDLPEDVWQSRLRWLDEQAAGFDAGFRQRLFADVRSGRLDGLQTSSLMNDLGYASRIFQSLRNVLMLGSEQALFRELRQFGDEQESLIKLS